MQDDQTEETGNSKASSLESELYLVGIGSSAGGLEAIREFVGNLPKKSSAAFVIVQHLSPDHQSLLTTLIDRETQLTVVDIKDGVKLEADTIYVTPPNWDVMVRGDHLILERPSFNGGSPKPSVDHFFRSAAEAFGTRAVGVERVDGEIVEKGCSKKNGEGCEGCMGGDCEAAGNVPA